MGIEMQMQAELGMHEVRSSFFQVTEKIVLQSEIAVAARSEMILVLITLLISCLI
uniref:Uncharacterized protein n=1 Tax=Oryza glaberrima TaxID=4538 RepID=I1PLA1_ORYGL